MHKRRRFLHPQVENGWTAIALVTSHPGQTYSGTASEAGRDPTCIDLRTPGSCRHHRGQRGSGRRASARAALLYGCQEEDVSRRPKLQNYRTVLSLAHVVVPRIRREIWDLGMFSRDPCRQSGHRKEGRYGNARRRPTSR